jgi:hypothetical protein
MWIRYGGNHPDNPSVYQRLGTWAGAAGVVAWLEGDYRGTTAGLRPRSLQGDDLGVVTTWVFMPPFTHHPTSGVEDDTANVRIGWGRQRTTGRQLNGVTHGRQFTRRRHRPLLILVERAPG